MYSVNSEHRALPRRHLKRAGVSVAESDGGGMSDPVIDDVMIRDNLLVAGELEARVSSAAFFPAPNEALSSAST